MVETRASFVRPGDMLVMVNACMCIHLDKARLSKLVTRAKGEEGGIICTSIEEEERVSDCFGGEVRIYDGVL